MSNSEETLPTAEPMLDAPTTEADLGPVAVEEQDDSGPDLYNQKIAWAVISGAILIYLIALPIRVLYYRYDYIEMKLLRLRPWVPVRRIWFEQLESLPSFGSQLLVQIVFSLSMLVLVAAVLYGLWLILVEADAEPTNDRADAA